MSRLGGKQCSHIYNRETKLFAQGQRCPRMTNKSSGKCAVHEPKTPRAYDPTKARLYRFDHKEELKEKAKVNRDRRAAKLKEEKAKFIQARRS